VPVLEALAERHPDLVLSVDTSKASVARAALAVGASVVNDVTALRADPELGPLLADAGAAVILMHMQGTPATMQAAPSYADVVSEVTRFLAEALARAREAGIPVGQTVVDPGIGFGKTVEHNLALLRRLSELRSLGRPILVGASRKSFLGRILDLEVQDRELASVVVHALAVLSGGATLVRVHDVAPTRQALTLVEALQRGWGGEPA
jgi:dihydropteroate synthase